MRPLKLIRKVFQVLKSGASPAQIALGVCLGALIGLVPLGWIILALFSLALAFEVRLGGVSLGAAVFKLVYFPLRPLAHALGSALLERNPALDPLWSRIVYAPGLAWLSLNRYLVLGGLALGLAVSLALFPLVIWGVRRYRTGYGQRLRSERLKRLVHTKVGKLVRWLAVGGEAKFQENASCPWPLRLIRWPVLVTLPLLYGLGYLVSALG